MLIYKELSKHTRLCVQVHIHVEKLGAGRISTWKIERALIIKAAYFIYSYLIIYDWPRARRNFLTIAATRARGESGRRRAHFKVLIY